MALNNIKIAYFSDLTEAKKIIVTGEISDVVRRSVTDITLSHNIELIQILSNAYGYHLDILLIYFDGILTGFIPFSIIRDRAVSLPHFSYGGYCGTSKIGQTHIETIIESLSKKYNNGFIIRDFQPFSKYIFTEKVTYFLKLQNSCDNQFSMFKTKLRSQIRKATKNGITVVPGNLEDFYLIYAENMHYKHGSPQLSKKLFHNLLHSYSSGDVKIFTAKYNGKVIGSGFLVGFHGFIEVCWASTSSKYNYLSPNMILYWTMISYAIEHKYKIFSFGRASKNTGSQRFKQQWGATEVPLVWSSDRPFNVSHNKFRLLTKIWRLAPSSVTNALSPVLTKYIY